MWMQDRTSLNFEPLRSHHPELASMDGYAEHYAFSDPESVLVKLRSFAERIVDHLYTRLQLPRAPQSNFADLLSNASFTIWPTDWYSTSFTCCASSATVRRMARMSPQRMPCAPCVKPGSSPDGSM